MPALRLLYSYPLRRTPTSRATFDQFEVTCRGASIVGGADGGQIVDRHLVDSEAAGVGAGSQATNASFAM
jgi:hypothetical protein